MSEADVARAKREAEAARARLIASARTLQARLQPATIAGNAWDSARDAGETAANTAARAVRQRPVVASAAAIGVAALVARKPLARLIARLRGRNG